MNSRICTVPISYLCKVTLATATIWSFSLPRSEAATLLSSPVMTGAFGSAAAAPGFSDTGGGRVGGGAQPLATASVATSGVGPATAANYQSTNATGAQAEQPQQAASRAYRAQRTGTHTERSSEPAPERPPVQFRVDGHAVPRPAPAHAPAPAGSVTTDAKGVVTPVLITTSPWTAELGVAYYTAYQSFRGVNILQSVTPEQRANGGVVNASLKLGYAREDDALTLGFNYWQGMNRVLAKGPIYDVPPNSNRRGDERFRLPSKDRYEEYNLNLSYSRNFFERSVVGTVGFNHFQFSNGNFWKSGDHAITHANEVMFGLAYTKLPIIQPSVSYAIDIDGFKGSYLEFRLDAAYEIYHHENITARLRPYIAVSYDYDYNGADNGWNAVEFGLNLPIRISNFFTITPTANYVLPLSQSEGEVRASDGFWAGVKLTVDWGGPSVPELKTMGKDKDAKIEVEDTHDHPWEVSVGAGWRQANFNFDHRSIPRYDTGGLFDRHRQNGDLGLATPGTRKVYGSGVVDARAGAATAPFTVEDREQVFNTPGNNGQVRFETKTYKYDTEERDFSGTYHDRDSVLSPTVSLDREFWHNGKWSARAGLLYAFTGTSGDSGYRLSHLDSVFQAKNIHGYVYSLDNFGGMLNQVVVDPAALVGGIPGFDSTQVAPQTELTKNVDQIVSVGTFVRSSIDLTAHDLALPFSFRYDFGNRIHVQAMVAPSVTLVQAELETEVERREFSDFAETQNHVKSTAEVRPPVSAAVLVNANFAGKAVAAQPVAQQQQTAQTRTAANKAASKGSVPQNPRYPGYLLSARRYNDSATEFLFGVTAGTSVILDLNKEKTFYAEVYGKYHWIQNFHMDDSVGQADVDLSTFELGIGMGYRF